MVKKVVSWDRPEKGTIRLLGNGKSKKFDGKKWIEIKKEGGK